jgi:LysR family transcriptional regulator for bpeEF and oprC
MINNYKKNKLDQLKGFCAVVEFGAIVEAAKKLHISESSISTQISSLERDLKINPLLREVMGSW